MENPGLNSTKPAQVTRGRFTLILGGLLLYALFLIIQMPATWLVARLPAESGIQLIQASGSPWHGAARQVIWRKGSDYIELGGLTWNWIPGELLHARLGLTFELGQTPAKLKGIFLLARDGLHLTRVQGRLDAAILGFASRPLSVLQPQGSLVLDIPDLHLGEKRIHGEARIDWQGARSALIAAPLGDYRAELRAYPDGRRAHVTLRTLQGALAMNVEGGYIPGKGIQGTLSLHPPQDERRTLYTPILSLLGQPDATGSWLLNLNSR